MKGMAMRWFVVNGWSISRTADLFSVSRETVWKALTFNLP